MNIIKFSTPSVIPSNWDKPWCSVKKPWMIKYRLYTDQGIRQVVIKKMNHLKTYPERYKVTKELLDAEINKLSNPITVVETKPAFVSKSKFTDLEEALLHMVELKRKTASSRHCQNLDTMVKRFCKVGRSYGLPLGVHGITRQTCLHILENMTDTLRSLKEKNVKSFSDNTYNRYVKDMGTLFNDLMYWEYTDYNPFLKMKKKALVKQLKRVATPAERKKIDTHVKERDYCFWRFMHIFFHSGAREAELVRMKMTDIHLKERFFVVEIRKGQSKRKEVKAILPAAYRHWAEIIAEGGEYPFGPDFQPGRAPVRVEQVSKLWRRYVKEELKFRTIDFYSLKHLHTDMIAATAGMDMAQTHDDHLQQSTTASIYAVGAKTRKLNALKQINVKF